MNVVQERAGLREWLGLVVLVLPAMLVSMDVSALFLALPRLSADLEPTSSQLLWISDIYGFLLAGMLITMGSLGDRIGRRKLLLIGAAAFGAISVLAAFSTSAEMLIAARALLGVAGATLAPSTLSLIRNIFHDSRQRTVAISVWTAGFAGGAVLGPIIGGILLERFWWGSIFLINVPAMVLLLLLGPVLLPEFLDPKPGRFDLLGAVLSLGAVLPIVYGIKMIAEDVEVSSPAVLSIVVGIGLGAVFLRGQRGPLRMIDTELFAKREFSMSIVVTTLTGFAMLGFSFLSSQYMMLVIGLGPFETALWNVPAFAAMMLSITLAAVLANKFPPGYIVAAGLAITASGFGVLTGIRVDSGLAFLIASMCGMLFGIGAVMGLATDMVLANAPKDRSGAASAISETANEFGGALGMAVLGSIGTAVYRSRILDSAPAGLPPHAADAAKDTLGGALAVSGQLPGELGGKLAALAKRAFTDGMQVTSVAAAVLLAIVAVLAAVFLRPAARSSGVRSGSSAPESPVAGSDR